MYFMNYIKSEPPGLSAPSTSPALIQRATTDPLTETPGGYSKHPWADLVAACKEEPGTWFEYHGWADKPASTSPVRVYADKIKRGTPAAFAPAGAFEAVARGRILFVRYVGGEDV